MKKLIAYKMSFEEAEDKLQNHLDNSKLALKPDILNHYFTAVSDSQCLDGSEVDERFAEILGVKECKNYIDDDCDMLIVVTKE